MAPDHAALQQAADWFAVLADPPVSAAQRTAWHQWLASRPEHAAAWRRVEAISGQFAGMQGDQRVAASALRGANRTRRQALGMFLLIGGGGLLAASGTGQLPWRTWAASERTGTGEIRQQRLADGTQLWLSARTALDIDSAARQLMLYQGEILLESAHSMQIETPQGCIQSAASRLSVRARDGQTLLGMFAGSARIEPQQGRPLSLQAGWQTRFSASGCGPAEPVDQARQAWSRGVLLADDRRLGDFIDELADHVPGYLGCDPRVADLRLVGAFPLGDVERIFGALQRTLPVRVSRRLPWWTTLEPV